MLFLTEIFSFQNRYSYRIFSERETYAIGADIEETKEYQYIHVGLEVSFLARQKKKMKTIKPSPSLGRH